MQVLSRVGKTCLLVVAVALGSTCEISLAQTPGTCVSDAEAELMDLVNAYRMENSLPAVPWSTTLITVGQYHAQDAAANAGSIFSPGCNLHSWSDTNPLWTGGCYTSDHANATLMWNKPREISGGFYTSTGYENAVSGSSSAASALNAWKNSPSHNAVILNQGIWAGYPWSAMGVGMNFSPNYAYLWFATGFDAAAEMPLCSASSGPVIFMDGFEDQP